MERDSNQAPERAADAAPETMAGGTINEPTRNDDPLVIAGKTYRSRLWTGSGKFRDGEETRRVTMRRSRWSLTAMAYL